MIDVHSKIFLVVSGYYPPIVGGTSTVIRNLLSAFRTDSYAVVSESPHALDGTHNSAIPEGVRVTRVGSRLSWLQHVPYGTNLMRRARFAAIPRIAKTIAQVAIQIKAERIIAVHPSWPFFIAALQAHRATGIPLTTYHMDITPQAGAISDQITKDCAGHERDAITLASNRLVLSEALKTVFEHRYGLPFISIPHAIGVPETDLPKREKKDSQQRTIIHTGVVEEMQIEGIRRIAWAIESAPDLRATLILSTPTLKRHLEREGLSRDCVRIESLTPRQVESIQRKADVAVAVMPFEPGQRSFGLTSFPTKILEYMLAGTPILAHAPRDSYFTAYMREHDCGLVVDEPSESALVEALRRLMTDPALCARLTQNAWRILKTRHDLRVVAGQFANAAGIA